MGTWADLLGRPRERARASFRRGSAGGKRGQQAGRHPRRGAAVLAGHGGQQGAQPPVFGGGGGGGRGGGGQRPLGGGGAVGDQHPRAQDVERVPGGARVGQRGPPQVRDALRRGVARGRRAGVPGEDQRGAVALGALGAAAGVDEAREGEVVHRAVVAEVGPQFGQDAVAGGGQQQQSHGLGEFAGHLLVEVGGPVLVQPPYGAAQGGECLLGALRADEP